MNYKSSNAEIKDNKTTIEFAIFEPGGSKIPTF